MKKRVKYRNFKFEAVRTIGSSWVIDPINYITQAIIHESTMEKAIETNRRYLDRVLHYNLNK